MSTEAAKSDIFIPLRQHKMELDALEVRIRQDYQKEITERTNLVNLMKSRSQITGSVQLLIGGQTRYEVRVGENLNVSIGGYDLYSGDELDLGEGKLGIADSITSDGTENKLLIVTNRHQYEIPVKEIDRHVTEGLFINAHFNTYRSGDNIAIGRKSRMGFLFIEEEEQIDE